MTKNSRTSRVVLDFRRSQFKLLTKIERMQNAKIALARAVEYAVNRFMNKRISRVRWKFSHTNDSLNSSSGKTTVIRLPLKC